MTDLIERIERAETAFRSNAAAGAITTSVQSLSLTADLLTEAKKTLRTITCPTHGDPLVCLACEAEDDADPTWGTDTPQLKALASAFKKMLPPALLADVVAHLDPVTPFVKFLREADARQEE